jgi:hypothetical protein
MGGEEKLRSLERIQIEGIGHTYYLEQSERPEGPWLVNYNQVTELRDYRQQRLRRTTLNRNIQSGEWTKGTTLVVADGTAAYKAGERFFPASPSQLVDADEALALSPDHVLLTALEAKDLHLEKDSALQGTAQHVVAFTWREATARIYLSAQTEMPTAIEFVRAYPASIFWNVWGDVTTRIYLSLWTIESGGLRYPRQLNVERNGTQYQEFTVTSLSSNPASDADAFSIPAEVKKVYDSISTKTVKDIPFGQPNRLPVEVAPGVVSIAGSWNVTLVHQADGVVIIEAPISPEYSASVLAETQKRFPGSPIKAVISTSDAWPHLGGIREYVARHIPIYALDLNRPILERVITTPHHLSPDALEQSRAKPRFIVVANKTVVGAGPNRMELYPIRSETGERMIMIYFPEHKLLYGSDLAQARQDGSFAMPEYLVELSEAVKREKLNVSHLFAMHMAARPWTDIEAAVARASTSK